MGKGKFTITVKVELNAITILKELGNVCGWLRLKQEAIQI